MRPFCLLLTILTLASAAAAQQPSGEMTGPPIVRPAYESGQGPMVAIDEAHKNTHTAGGQLQGLVRLLRRDGYRVRPFAEAISMRSLEGVDILVIAQPGGWEGPNESLQETEVNALIEWVQRGGSLLLILDHRPAPAGGQMITAALGVEQWHNGYAVMDTPTGPVGRIRFQRAGRQAEPGVFQIFGGQVAWQGPDARVLDHVITAGRSENERVDSVVTFVGSAFRPAAGAEPLLTLPQSAVSVDSDAALRSSQALAESAQVAVSGWAQGAVMKLGRGRVALFGEAGLFSAQWPVHPAAAENYKLVLNVMHWLTGIL